MNAVWSFWSKPYREGASLEWCDEYSRFCSWKLSFELANPFFSKTILVTDEFGKDLLVSVLGLDFDYVDVKLNSLDALNSQWWALGKLYSYLLQDEPFLHIDSDVYLHKKPEDRLLQGDVIAQNYEHFSYGNSWYHPQKFYIIRNINGYLPKEVSWYIEQKHDQKAICCGVFGGNDLAFIQYYASLVFHSFLHKKNFSLWSLLGGDNILLEQYMLSACIEYYLWNKEHPFSAGVSVECFFDSSASAFNPVEAKKSGYTHLIGGAKKNKMVCERLKRRVFKDYPDFYERCRKAIFLLK